MVTLSMEPVPSLRLLLDAYEGPYNYQFWTGVTLC